MTTLTWCPRSHWLCWHRVGIAVDYADTRFLWISSRKRKSSRNCFYLFIWGPGWKKCSKISWHSPFKIWTWGIFFWLLDNFVQLYTDMRGTRIASGVFWTPIYRRMFCTLSWRILIFEIGQCSHFHYIFIKDMVTNWARETWRK